MHYIKAKPYTLSKALKDVSLRLRNAMHVTPKIQISLVYE